MSKYLLNIIFAASFLYGFDKVQAQEVDEVSTTEPMCDEPNLGQPIRVRVDATQLGILEYDRIDELLFFNIYAGIVYKPNLHLKTSMKGLAFVMTPKDAMEITRLYSLGIYKIELLFLPVMSQSDEGVASKKQDRFCQIYKTHRTLNISPLKISLLDADGKPIQSIYTKRGKLQKAQITHDVRNYRNKSVPKVVIEVSGESLSKAKNTALQKAIERPLFNCYQRALEKNGRFQGSIIFRFEDGKTRAIHSNKNVIFGNCVTRSVEKNLPINFEKKITLRTIFRLERK